MEDTDIGSAHEGKIKRCLQADKFVFNEVHIR